MLNKAEREERRDNGRIPPGGDLAARLIHLRQDLRMLAPADPRAAGILLEMGGLTARLGNLAGSIDLYAQCRERAAAAGDLRAESRALEGMGALHIRRHDYPAALQCYLDCLRLNEDRGDPAITGAVWLQIGVIYGQLEDHEQALTCFRRSAQIFEDAGQLYMKVRAMVNIANILRSRGELASALDTMFRALMIFEELGDRSNVAESLAIIANIYEKQGELDVALDYSRRAFDTAERLMNPVLCATLLLNIGSICRRKGEHAQALVAVVRGLAIASEGGSLLLECQLNELAAFIYEESGELGQALEHHKRFARAREEFARRKKEEVVTELQVRFDVEQTERERDLYRTQAWDLRREVHDKTKELTAVTLSLVQKSEFLDQMKQQLADILAATKERSDKIVRPMIDEMTAGANTEEGWKLFEQQFDSVNRDFMRTLAERYPSLTPMELKICALSKVDLSTKEIAKMLFVSVRNVQNHRYRLRKKLRLDPDANLVSFLTSI